MVTMNIETLEPPPDDMVIAFQVEIKPSEVDSDRLGIWCKETITAGTKFGPFQGERVQVGTRDMDPSFVWEIVDLESKEFLFYINATDPKSGNWMRYINCARYFEEQNIVCKQEGMDIYYASIKDIQPGEELLTWYEKTPFRKRKSKPISRKTQDGVDEVDLEAKENGEAETQGSVGDMHTSQRGRTRKVTKYWEMENQDISEVSDFQRDSEVNSDDDDDDVMIASDDDWSINGRDEAMKEDADGEADGALCFRFELQPYHIVLSRLGRKVFQCDVCSGIYRHSFSLKRHYIRNHVNHAFVSNTDLIHCNITVSKSGEKEESMEKKCEDEENMKKKSEDEENMEKKCEEEENMEKKSEMEVDNMEKKCEKEVKGKDAAEKNNDFRTPELNDDDKMDGEMSAGGSVKEENILNGNSDEENENSKEKSEDLNEKSEDLNKNSAEKSEDANVKSAFGNESTEDVKREEKMAADCPDSDSEDGAACTDALKERDEDQKNEVRTTENEVRIEQEKALKTFDEENREKENEDPDKKNGEAEGDKIAEGEDVGASSGKKSPDVDQNSNSSDEVNSNRSETSATSFKAPQHMADLYRCNVCEKLFDCIPDLKAHLANHPESSSKAYACDKCNMKFSHKQNLMRHAAVHTVLGPKPFICKFCGKKFSTLTNQRRHERIHQGRRLSCLHCASTFSQTGDLKKHVKKFHPEYFHDCPGCAKYYATPEELVEHATEAHGERHEPEDEDTGHHTCKFCSKRFVTSTSRRRHERAHQGMRVQCPHCRSSFSQTPALKKHIKKLHSDKFHECPACGKFFNSAASLGDHTARSHSSENSSSALVSCYALDTESDKAESMRLAYQRSSTCTKPQLKYACTVCRKQFHDYSNMCRHRSMAHHQQMLQLSSLKKQDDSSPLRSLFDPDMERNSAFYARVARNIADNLKFHMEGTQEGLKQSEALIKWHKEGGDEQEGKNVHNLLEGYNFPQGYQLQENADLLNRKVPLEEYIEWSGLLEAERKRSVVTSRENQEEEKEEEPSAEEQRDTPPDLSPNGSMSLRVPAMKLCRMCHSVFHSEAVFLEHLQRQHGARVGSPPPAHHHPRPLQLLPPRWLPGINPNRIPSLVIPPNAVPPPAHQTSPAPPQLSPALPPQLTLAAPLKEKKQEEKKKKDEQEAVLVTGDDPDPSPKKHICLVCYDEFPEAELLSAHQDKWHATVQCKGLTVDLSFNATWFTRPTAVGLLDVTSNQIPIPEEEQRQSETHCTKCEREFASRRDLHAHILDCGDYGRNAPRLAYIWYLRGQVITPSKKGKKTGYGKYRRGRNTMQHQQKKKKKWVEESEGVREEAQLMAQRRLLERALESPDEDSSEYGQRRRRRRVQELFYNPSKHVRRRDLAELLGSRCFGCGETFEVVSLLERHIPSCPDKEKILGSSEGLANRQMQAEEDDSDNEYDASKHMCIYCERYFTYLGMLRKHVLDVCAKRRELVEADEYIDEEWEAELNMKTGHTSGRRTLSRQSSMSSLNGVLAEEQDNSQDSFEQRPRRKRRRRGHNWGYKPKGSKRRAEEDEDEAQYMIEESFFADIESSNSRVASVGEDESSNDGTVLAKKEQMKEDEEEEKKEEEKKVIGKEEKVKEIVPKAKTTKSKKKTAAQATKKESLKKAPTKATTCKKKQVELDDDDDVKLSELAKKRKSKSPNPSPKKTKTDESNVNGNISKKKRKSDESVERKTVKKPRSKLSESEKPKVGCKKTESSLAGNMQLKGKLLSKKSIA